ncbi:MAG: acylneuraminate cytidylyltransferase family protein [Deltaproteobacteria bacterium]|nr:acylneuraminate cytidylyltransferase family protein [Deltaproteobacteria bacterium]
MDVLGVVTARGGSKGVPRKNIRLLGGKPLLAWTAEAALSARSLTKVILSTDDEEIAAIGRAAHLEVPFMRPPELAQDRTPTLAVLQHAVGWVEAQGERYDAVCLLQPTSPLRTAATIDGCIAKLVETGADAVVTVLRVPAEHNPHWVYFASVDGDLHLATGETEPISRRQDLPPAYHREGSVYVTQRDVLIEQSSLYGARVIGYEVDASTSVNIDSLEDWARAESLVRPGA